MVDYNNQMCLSLDEWKEAGLTETLYKSDKKRGYLKVVRNGHNGSQALISLDSIVKPDRKAKIIEFFGDPNIAEAKTQLESKIKEDHDAIMFFSSFTLPDGRYLTTEKIVEYSNNAKMLNAIADIYNDFVKTRKRLGSGKNTGFWEKASQAILRINKHTEHSLPKNQRVLQRIMNEYAGPNYDQKNYITLISKKFCNDNSRKVDDSTISLLNNMFATQNTKPTYADIQRQYDGFLSGYITIINNETGEMYDPSGFSKLSSATVANYLADWSNKIGNEAIRSGDRQVYMGKYRPHHKLIKPRYASSIISIDDRQPPFEYEKGKRMWFYNGIDLASGAYTVSVYGKTKEGIILEFYRQMLRNYHQWGFNLPAELEAEKSLNSSYESTFLRPGVMFEFVRIEANNARGKRIEQYYRQLRYSVEKMDEDWIARPFARSEANQVKPGEKKYIPYEQLANKRIADLEKWNNMPYEPGSSITRWEYFVQNQNPDLKPTNYRLIIPMLGYREKSSCRVGRIQLQGQKFLLGDDGVISTGEKLLNYMRQIEGEDIDVYWLDGNDGKVMKAYAFIEGRIVCELIGEPGYHRSRKESTETDSLNRTLMSSYEMTVVGYGKRQQKKIDKITIDGEIPQTLNSKFVMPGFGRELKLNDKPNSVEIELGDFKDDFKGVETNFKSKLGDRF